MPSSTVSPSAARDLLFAASHYFPRKFSLPNCCSPGTLPPVYICGRFRSLLWPPFHAEKMLEDCTILVQSKSFRCNTSEIPRMCCKQRTCATPKSLRCNTYTKPGGAPSPRCPPLHPLPCPRKTVLQEKKAA